MTCAPLFTHLMETINVESEETHSPSSAQRLEGIGQNAPDLLLLMLDNKEDDYSSEDKGEESELGILSAGSSVVVDDRKPRKKKTKKNAGANKNAEKANVVAAGLDEAEAQVKGVKDAAKMIADDISVDLDDGSMYVINWQKLEMGHNTRDFIFVEHDNRTVSVIGYKAKFGKKNVMYVNGRFGCLEEDDVVLGVSNCEKVCVVLNRPAHNYDKLLADGPSSVTVGNEVFMFVGGPEERLRNCVRLCIDKYLTSKMMSDSGALAWEAARMYKREWGSMQNIEGRTRMIVDESWVLPRLTSVMEARLMSRYARMVPLAKALMLQHGWLKDNRLKRVLKALFKHWCFGFFRGFVGHFMNDKTLVVREPFFGNSFDIFRAIQTLAAIVNAWKGIDWVIQAVTCHTLIPCVELLAKPRVMLHDVLPAGWGINAETLVAKFQNKPGAIITACVMKRFPKTIVRDRIYPPMRAGVSLDVESLPMVPNKGVENYGITIENANLVVPANTSENLECAIRMRMAFDRTIDPVEWAKFYAFAKNYIDALPLCILEGVSCDDIIKSKYNEVRAAEIISNKGQDLTDEDVTCKMFVKGEAYAGKTEENMKCRMIFSRTDKVLYYYAGMFHEIYKWMKMTFSKDSEYGMYYTSGDSADDLGDVAEDFDRYRSIVCADTSSFDGSMHEGFLDIELYFLDTKVVNKPDEYGWLRKNWHRVEGKSRGIRYKAKYGRRSGDYWTSTFNSLLNDIILKYHFGMQSRSMVQGDDSVAVTNDDVDDDSVIESYKRLGLVVELKTVLTMADADFCSGRFWKNYGRYKWGTMPLRAMMKMGMNFGDFPRKKHMGLLLGTAKSMLCIAGHVPILGALLRMIIDTGTKAGVKVIADKRWDNPYGFTGGLVTSPAADTYDQFQRLYGISPDLCELFELMISALDINDFPMEVIDRTLEIAASVDVPHEFSGARYEKGGDNNYIISVAPRLEEAWKLRVGDTEGFFKTAWDFGCQEMVENEGGGTSRLNPILHVIFTSLSLINFELGVCVHSLWNRLAVASSMTPCKRKKKRNVQPVAVVNVNTANPPRRRHKRKKNGRRGAKIRHPCVIARITPFSDLAIGAKYPDTFMYPTTSFTLRCYAILSSSAGGQVGMSIQPQFVNTVWSATTPAATMTWSVGSGTNSFGNPDQQFSSYRVVGWGVKIEGAYLVGSATGSLVVSHVPQVVDTDVIGYTYFPTTQNNVTSLMMHDRVSLYSTSFKPVYISGRAIDEGTLRFRDMQYPAAAGGPVETNTGWANIVIMGTLLPNSAQVATVEVIMHCEGLQSYAGNASNFGMNSAPEPENLQQMSQLNRMSMDAPILIQEDNDTDILGRLEDTIEQVDAMAAKAARIVYKGANMAYNVGATALKARSFYKMYQGQRPDFMVDEKNAGPGYYVPN